MTQPQASTSDHQKLKKNHPFTAQNGRQLSSSNLYARCMNSKNPATTKRVASPPPPIYLSPTGLLAPPPPQPAQQPALTPPVQQRSSSSLSYRPAATGPGTPQYLYPLDVNNNRAVPSYPAPGAPSYQMHHQQPRFTNKENMNNGYNKKKFNELREIFENNNRLTTHKSSSSRDDQISRSKMPPSPVLRQRVDQLYHHHQQHQHLNNHQNQMFAVAHQPLVQSSPSTPQPPMHQATRQPVLPQTFCPEFLSSDFARGLKYTATPSSTNSLHPLVTPLANTPSTKTPKPVNVVNNNRNMSAIGMMTSQPQSQGLYNHLNHYHFRKNDQFNLFMNK